MRTPLKKMMAFNHILPELIDKRMLIVKLAGEKRF
jgi:hypothetical protein